MNCKEKTINISRQIFSAILIYYNVLRRDLHRHVCSKIKRLCGCPCFKPFKIEELLLQRFNHVGNLLVPPSPTRFLHQLLCELSLGMINEMFNLITQQSGWIVKQQIISHESLFDRVLQDFLLRIAQISIIASNFNKPFTMIDHDTFALP